MKNKHDEANKKIKEPSADLAKAQTDQAALESVKLEVDSLEKEVKDLKEANSELTTMVANFDEDSQAMLRAANEEVEEKIKLAWNSHFDMVPEWVLGRY